jgi:Icc-related predicted phosphoesterase
MTKIGFCSDIHLEFEDRPNYRLDLLNRDNIDLLILAGDISTPHMWKQNHDNFVRRIEDEQLAFFRDVSERFPKVFYIPGNHEHYHGDINETTNILKDKLSKFNNIFVDEQLVVTGDDFVVIGTTLWTDFEKGNPNSLIYANMGMNDFGRLIKSGRGKFRALDAAQKHNDAIIFLEANLEGYKDVKTKIVVTHHLPSLQVISPGFRDDRLNGAYASNLDWLIEKHNPDYWIHGHSHPPIDLTIGKTRLMRNPRGYVGREHSAEDDKKYSYKLIEI